MPARVASLAVAARSSSSCNLDPVEEDAPFIRHDDGGFPYVFPGRHVVARTRSPKPRSPRSRKRSRLGFSLRLLEDGGNTQSHFLPRLARGLKIYGRFMLGLREILFLPVGLTRRRGGRSEKSPTSELILPLRDLAKRERAVVTEIQWTLRGPPSGRSLFFFIFFFFLLLLRASLKSIHYRVSEFLHIIRLLTFCSLYVDLMREILWSCE